ncbi:MAG TPA: hypothetical protein VFL91_31365 [Thermomicrobiales bacterium]|nr:hypothetical protein [Thermomicrobiales bacterium]
MGTASGRSGDEASAAPAGLAPALALAQGAYYLLTGVWPLVSIGTFQRLTGPKADRWLVKTVGVLVAASGGALLSAGRRRRLTPELAGLAASSAAGLAAIDVVYAAKGRIAPIYLLDALVELALVAGWAGAWAARDA